MRIRTLLLILTIFITIGGILYYHTHKSVIYSSQSLELERLKSLPYALWSKEKAETSFNGVVKYDANKSFPGYNFYTDRVQYAYLMDMRGEIVHRWTFPFGGWEHAELLRNGEIIILVDGKYSVKLDQNSNIVWAHRLPVHHDIAVLSDNTYLVPAYIENVLYNSKSAGVPHL